MRSPTDRTTRPHDRLFRHTFGENLEAAAGELRAVLPLGIVSAVDWSTLELADPALLGPDLSERTADLLFRVRLAGQEALLFVLLEHQSVPDALFVVRALVYVARVWERWLRQNPSAVRVPPVVPVLLTHAAGGWRVARALHEVIELGEGELRAALEPLVPSLRLAVIDDLETLDDDALDARTLPPSAKLALAALRDIRPSRDLVATLQHLEARWMRALRESDPRDAAAIEAFLSYIPAARPQDDLAAITRAVQAVRPTGREVIMATVQQLIEARASEARAEGKAEGKAEEARHVLARLLVRRFGSVSRAMQDRLDVAEAATLDRWIERVLDVRSEDELLSS